MDIFYNPHQNVDDNVSFSPSAGKPKHVVASWKELGFPLRFPAFEPVMPADLKLAHDPAYVDGVLAGTTHNGFGNTLASVAQALPWVVGSFVAAARHALINRVNTASPTSGFHHARWDGGGGFCTFNGLIVAAEVLRRDDGLGKVAILDLDKHYGDGTLHIIKHKKLGYVNHYTFGSHGVRSDTADAWLDSLAQSVRKLAEGCDLVLYQAGADPHIEDPLGGALTGAQLRMRDRIVFRTLHEMGVPVAWNLAGGYQTPLRKVLDVHDATLQECMEASGETAR